jgi:hypothetical protein
LDDLADILPSDPVIREAATQQMVLRVRMVNNKFKAIFQAGWADVTPMEEYVATAECRYDPDEVATEIRGEEFRRRIRGLVAQKIAQAREPRPAPAPSAESSDEEDEEEIAVRSKRAKPKPKPRATRSGGLDRNEVPEGVSQEEWDDFPPWKRKIYLEKEENPNAYYYRFVDPDEERRSGAWSPAERKHFIAQMKLETGDGHFTGKWGLFARGIPGRVGYECRNYYDRLVKAGEFEDDRYGEDMKVMKKSEREGGSVASTPKKRAPNTRRRVPEPESEEEDEVGLDPEANPFAKMVDPFTFEPMAQPMASPGGVVLNKDTWTSMLQEGNIAICPYTRVPVKRRSLEPMTWENFDEWAPKLKNWLVDEDGEISPPDQAPPEVVLE